MSARARGSNLTARKCYRIVFRLNDGTACTWEQYHPNEDTARAKMLEAARREYPGKVTGHVMAEVYGPGGAIIQ